jgi:hypothetical protein
MTDPQQTVADAKALIAAVEQSLADGDARLRDLGLDPDKVRAWSMPLNAQQQQELERLIAADRDAVEQEVAQARTILQGTARTIAPGKPRSFI